MEDPLIGRESRGGGVTDRIVRRSEAITHGTTFQKAAALVDLVLYLFTTLFFFDSSSSDLFEKSFYIWILTSPREILCISQLIKSMFCVCISLRNEHSIERLKFGNLEYLTFH